MTEGDMIPDATLTAAEGTPLRLHALIGQPLVLYFYPKDDTSGCTREAQDFSALAPRFAAAGVRVLGVSKDSPESHVRFAAKHALAVPLASDTDGLIEAFGAWIEKAMYGRTYMGIDRSTFLFGSDGRLVRAWRKVRVAGHAETVLAAALELNTTA